MNSITPELRSKITLSDYGIGVRDFGTGRGRRHSATGERYSCASRPMATQFGRPRVRISSMMRNIPTSIGTTSGKVNLFLEFEKLGTYQVTWHAVAKRSSLHGSENCNPNAADPPVNQTFCASETYTFHVGPMAELAVEDGGASSRVPANRDALTIVAVNNGPDEPSGGARMTGLPTGRK